MAPWEARRGGNWFSNLKNWWGTDGRSSGVCYWGRSERDIGDSQMVRDTPERHTQTLVLVPYLKEIIWKTSGSRFSGEPKYPNMPRSLGSRECYGPCVQVQSEPAVTSPLLSHSRCPRPTSICTQILYREGCTNQDISLLFPLLPTCGCCSSHWPCLSLHAKSCCWRPRLDCSADTYHFIFSYEQGVGMSHLACWTQTEVLKCWLLSIRPAGYSEQKCRLAACCGWYHPAHGAYSKTRVESQPRGF